MKVRSAETLNGYRFTMRWAFLLLCVCAPCTPFSPPRPRVVAPLSRLSPLSAIPHHPLIPNPSKSKSLLAGRLFPYVSGLASPQRLRIAIAAVKKEILWGDLALLVSLVFLSRPLLKFVDRGGHKLKRWRSDRAESIAGPVESFGWVTALLYLVDCVCVFLKSLRAIPSTWQVSQVLALVIYPLWMAGLASRVKKNLILTNFSGPKGQALLYDRIADVALYFLLSFYVLEVCAEAAGASLKSLFAFGGFSTVLFGLACQDTVSQLVSGLILTLSDKVRPGEEVKFGDGTAGIIQSMGWFDILLRSYDESILRIPNAEIATKRLCNISRCSRSRVKTSLRIRYRDIDKIQEFADSIKDTIKDDLEDQVVTDGTRPFWVHWRDYNEDHLDITIDVHLNVPLGTTRYYDTRMKVMDCLRKSAEKSNIKYAMPARVSLPYVEEGYHN